MTAQDEDRRFEEHVQYIRKDYASMTTKEILDDVAAQLAKRQEYDIGASDAAAAIAHLPGGGRYMAMEIILRAAAEELRDRRRYDSQTFYEG